MSASVIGPLEQAVRRARQITFQPFDLGKWFVLGFAAWLATLGESGGGFNFNFNFRFPAGGGGFPPRGGPLPGNPPVPGNPPLPGVADVLKPIWDWITANWTLAVAIAAAGAAGLILLGLFFCWVRSRATFIFLDNLALNQTAIVAPWKSFRKEGNSLFCFSVCLGVVALVCYAAVAGSAVAVAWPDIRAQRFGPHALTAIFMSLAMLPLALILGLVGWCTNNFVAPLMYLRRETVLPAWREFRTALLPGNIGRFLLFLLMQFLVRVAIGMITVLLGCLTCCLGFLPYLGTVVTLPLVVFDRSYPVYFLEQFGPDYSIFVELLDSTGGPTI